MAGMGFSAVLRRMKRATVLAAAGLAVAAPAARAQGLFSMFEPSPQQIERRLERAGFEFRSALVRRGDVYVCDVLGRAGDGERLIIDARTGDILERFRTRGDDRRYAQGGDRRERESAGAWGYPPRPMIDVPYAGPRTATQEEPADKSAARPPAKPKQMARMDLINPSPAMPSISKNSDKPKPKPKVAKKQPTDAAPEPATASVGPEATAPAGDAGAPAATPIATPKAEGKPDVGAAAPGSTSAAPPNPAAPTPAGGVAAPPVAATPAAAAPAPKTVEADVAKPAVDAKPSLDAKPVPAPEKNSKSKAVNDLPVNPLD